MPNMTLHFLRDDPATDVTVKISDGRLTIRGELPWPDVDDPNGSLGRFLRAVAPAVAEHFAVRVEDTPDPPDAAPNDQDLNACPLCEAGTLLPRRDGADYTWTCGHWIRNRDTTDEDERRDALWRTALLVASTTKHGPPGKGPVGTGSGADGPCGYACVKCWAERYILERSTT